MSLTSKGHFKIGTSEYLAKTITPSFDSLASDDSGRTDDGVMHITWVKSKLRKWEIEMPPCSSADYAILNAVQGKTYDMTIWDISTNSEQLVHCYTSSAKGSCYSGIIHNGLW